MPKMTSSLDRDDLRRYKYARTADRDLEIILQYTTQRFGQSQRQQYAELIDRAAALVAADPLRHGSRPREELAPGLRSFHVERAARRRGAAAHVLYYTQGTLNNGRADVIILRVLHERMDPARHFALEP